jgi:hypothetical protein
LSFNDLILSPGASGSNVLQNSSVRGTDVDNIELVKCHTLQLSCHVTDLLNSTARDSHHDLNVTSSDQVGDLTRLHINHRTLEEALVAASIMSAIEQKKAVACCTLMLDAK